MPFRPPYASGSPPAPGFSQQPICSLHLVGFVFVFVFLILHNKWDHSWFVLVWNPTVLTLLCLTSLMWRARVPTTDGSIQWMDYVHDRKWLMWKREANSSICNNLDQVDPLQTWCSLKQSSKRDTSLLAYPRTTAKLTEAHWTSAGGCKGGNSRSLLNRQANDMRTFLGSAVQCCAESQ